MFPPSLSLEIRRALLLHQEHQDVGGAGGFPLLILLFERICMQERGGTEGALRAHFLQSILSFFINEILPFSLALPLSIFRS